MKMKLGIAAAVVLLILAQLVFGGKKGADGKNAATGPQSSGTTVATTAKPSPDQIDRVDIGHPGMPAALRLHRTPEGWALGGVDGARADGAKVDRLLRHLLTGESAPADVSPADAGLDQGQGVDVALTPKNGAAWSAVVGLRPAGDFDSTYLRAPGGGIRLLKGDVRAELGLWKNQPDALPDTGEWLDRTVLRFDPAGVTEISATYPDHVTGFKKDHNGEWQPIAPVPGGEWSKTGLEAWLADLSRFQVSGLAENPEDSPRDETNSPRTHQIVLTFDDGSEKTVDVNLNNADDDAVVRVSDAPGLAFNLPEWRFARYFRRLHSLFPKAAPNFDFADIRFIDIRQGGESVKIVRRGDRWEAVAVPYEPKQEHVDRLARLLASWKPEDFVDPRAKGMRASFGGPMVEVILARGEVHQYRLAGRHPRYPWRYVNLDGKVGLAATNQEIGVMFPELADILYLGNVFTPVPGVEVSEVALADAGGHPMLLLSRSPEGEWTAEKGGERMALATEEGDGLLEELMALEVAGFHGSHPGQEESTPMYQLRVSSGTTHSTITLHQPTERDIPYVTDEGHSFLVGRPEFFNWLGDAKKVITQLELKAQNEALAAERQKHQEERERQEQSAAEDAAAENEAPKAEETPAAEPPHAEPLEVEHVATETELSPEPEAETGEAKEEADRPEEDSTPAESAEILEPAREALADPAAADALSDPVTELVDSEPGDEFIAPSAPAPRKVSPEDLHYSGRIRRHPAFEAK